MKKRHLCLFIVNIVGILLLTGCVGSRFSDVEYLLSEDLKKEVKFEDGKFFLDVTLGDTQTDVLTTLGQPDYIYDEQNGAFSYFRYDDVEWYDHVGAVLVYWEYQVPGVSCIRWEYKSTDEKEIRYLNNSIENDLKKNYEKVDYMDFYTTYRKDNIEFSLNDEELDAMDKTEDGEILHTASLSVSHYITPYVISDAMHFMTVSDNSDIAIVTDFLGQTFAKNQVCPKKFVMLHEAEYTMRREVGKIRFLQWDSNTFHIIDINDHGDVEINVSEKMVEAGLEKESWQMDPCFTPMVITLNNKGQEVPCLEIKCIDTSSKKDFKNTKYIDLIIDGNNVTATASFSSLISPTEDKVVSEKWQTQIAAIEKYLEDGNCLVNQSEMPGSTSLASVLEMYSATCVPSSTTGTILIQLPAAAVDTSEPFFLEKFPEFADYEWDEDDVLTLYINDYPSVDDIKQFLRFLK